MTSSHSNRRSRGEGSVYRIADGRWRASLILTHPLTGQQGRRYVSGRSRSEAVRRLDALKKEAVAGGFPTGETTGAYLARWLVADRQRVRAATHRQREQMVRLYLAPALGSVPLAKLAPLDVERMTSALVASGRSARTASHARVVLRRALADALRDGAVSRNVAALARPPRVVTREMAYLDAAQLRHLLASAAEHPLGPLVTVAATTGLRQGELLGLSWSDVDLDAGRLTVRRALARSYDGWAVSDTKTHRSRRTLHLPARAVDALHAQLQRQEAQRAAVGSAWQDPAAVFADGVGRRLRGYDVNLALTRLLAAAGLPHIAFHGLRHSAASALLTAGVPLRVVADQLGHSTITLTANTYGHIGADIREEAARAMDRALGGPEAS